MSAHEMKMGPRGHLRVRVDICDRLPLSGSEAIAETSLGYKLDAIMDNDRLYALEDGIVTRSGIATHVAITITSNGQPNLLGTAELTAPIMVGGGNTFTLTATEIISR